MEMRLYTKTDDEQLFDMMREEGKDWSCYYEETGIDRYKRALRSSRAYVAYEGPVLCGYIRCKEDDGFGIYVYDLLVRPAYRGREIGRKLMERVCSDFPDEDVHVMSGVDGYYEKQGYSREGSIFKVTK
jgi:ribosomal protein S18 acetylase RimI-like enzyme